MITEQELRDRFEAMSEEEQAEVIAKFNEVAIMAGRNLQKVATVYASVGQTMLSAFAPLRVWQIRVAEAIGPELHKEMRRRERDERNVARLMRIVERRAVRRSKRSAVR